MIFVFNIEINGKKKKQYSTQREVKKRHNLSEKFENILGF
jgi:hypothetical protein